MDDLDRYTLKPEDRSPEPLERYRKAGGGGITLTIAFGNQRARGVAARARGRDGPQGHEPVPPSPVVPARAAGGVGFVTTQRSRRRSVRLQLGPVRLPIGVITVGGSLLFHALLVAVALFAYRSYRLQLKSSQQASETSAPAAPTAPAMPSTPPRHGSIIYQAGDDTGSDSDSGGASDAAPGSIGSVVRQIEAAPDIIAEEPSLPNRSRETTLAPPDPLAESRSFVGRGASDGGSAALPPPAHKSKAVGQVGQK